MTKLDETIQVFLKDKSDKTFTKMYPYLYEFILKTSMNYFGLYNHYALIDALSGIYINIPKIDDSRMTVSYFRSWSFNHYKYLFINNYYREKHKNSQYRKYYNSNKNKFDEIKLQEDEELLTYQYNKILSVLDDLIKSGRYEPFYKELFIKKYIEGVKFKDLSVIYNMNISTLKSKMYNVRNLIYHIIKESKDENFNNIL